VFLLNGFLTLITLYVMAPFMHHRLKRYQHDNTWFGTTRCSFHATLGQFYKIYLLVFAAMVAFLGIVFAMGVPMIRTSLQAQDEGTPPSPENILTFVALLYGTLLLISVLVYPTFRALLTNLIWNNTRVGEHQIECRISPRKLVWITVSNFVAVVVSIGFLIPWAAVRLSRYQLSCMKLLPVSDLQEFVAAESENVGALGEEATGMFDFDIAL
jgi:uncharacterized membrane protein YjgN (DUF898 family)